MSHWRGLALFAAGVLLAFRVALAAPSQALERAVLAGDWSKVLQEAAADPAPDSSVRHLAGHGFLAVDRGNDAVCMFAGAAGNDDQLAWLSWTTGLADRQPASPMARFLHGDALARLGNWSIAREELDQALSLRPGDPALLNARASVRAAVGDWMGAQADLGLASQAPHPLLDVRTTFGVFAILQRLDPGVADRAFRDVLHQDSTLAIALNGRGAAAIADLNWDQARDFYRQAAVANPCLLLSLDNLVLLEQTELDELRRRTAPLLAALNPGSPAFRDIATRQDGMEHNLATARKDLDTAKMLNVAQQVSNWSGRILGDATVATMALGAALVPAPAAKVGLAVSGMEVAHKSEATFASLEQDRKAQYSAISAIQSELKYQQPRQPAIPLAQGSSASPGTNNSSSRNPSLPPGSTNPVGGVDTGSSPDATDTGRWPVMLRPTLLYDISPSVSR